MSSSRKDLLGSCEQSEHTVRADCIHSGQGSRYPEPGHTLNTFRQGLCFRLIPGSLSPGQSEGSGITPYVRAMSGVHAHYIYQSASEFPAKTGPVRGWDRVSCGEQVYCDKGPSTCATRRNMSHAYLCLVIFASTATAEIHSSTNTIVHR